MLNLKIFLAQQAARTKKDKKREKEAIKEAIEETEEPLTPKPQLPPHRHPQTPRTPSNPAELEAGLNKTQRKLENKLSSPSKAELRSLIKGTKQVITRF